MDIETLRFIWWILLGVLIMGFAVTDGFDLGIAILYPLVARNETEKTIVLNSIRPYWEGNQVWIILGAGAIFAAWPFVYAVVFSSAYFPMFLVLLTLGISRPVSFKYREKLPSKIWQRAWDQLIFIGGIVPTILFGILIGNILIGFPFHFDSSLRIFFDGDLLGFFHPFAIWCGITSIAMLVMHGGWYLAIKTNDPIQRRAIYFAKIAGILLVLFFAGGGLWIAYGIPGYETISNVDPQGYSNPLYKQVGLQMGAWMNNYLQYPLTLIAPILGFLGALFASFTPRQLPWVAFMCSGVSIMGIIATIGVSMFPFILPSSTHYASSLLVWDASSSQLTLLIMFIAAIFFMPIIMLYTSWVYYALRGKVRSSMGEE